MPNYVVLIKLTEQGRRNLKQTPQNVRQVMQMAGQQGATFKEWYLTMGPYDAVSIVEAPSDEVLASGVLSELVRGEIESLTMRAFTLEETENLLNQLPSRP
jgi:uncharacterized protein with GYD domain